MFPVTTSKEADTVYEVNPLIQMSQVSIVLVLYKFLWAFDIP